MRHAVFWLFAAFLTLAPLTPAPAQTIADADRQAIQSVIDRQIAAFKRDDGREAFGYAAPDLQAQFGSSDIFMSMVKTGYAAVYRPRVYQFRDVMIVNGVMTQQVYVIGRDGVPLFITICMPVRNEERFVTGVIQQLLNQDYPKDRFESVVADGESTDRSKEIVAGIAKTSPQVRLFDNLNAAIQRRAQRRIQERQGRHLLGGGRALPYRARPVVQEHRGLLG